MGKNTHDKLPSKIYFIETKFKNDEYGYQGPYRNFPTAEIKKQIVWYKNNPDKLKEIEKYITENCKVISFNLITSEKEIIDPLTKKILNK